MLFCIITMVLGVGVFGDFVGAVTGMESSDPMLEDDRIKKEEIIKKIKNNYKIQGSGLIYLD